MSLRLNATVAIEVGTFAGCLKTKEWSPLSPGSVEHKYYCPSGGGLMLVNELHGGTVQVEFTAARYQRAISPPPAFTATESGRETAGLGSRYAAEAGDAAGPSVSRRRRRAGRGHGGGHAPPPSGAEATTPGTRRTGAGNPAGRRSLAQPPAASPGGVAVWRPAT